MTVKELKQILKKYDDNNVILLYHPVFSDYLNINGINVNETDVYYPKNPDKKQIVLNIDNLFLLKNG